MFELPNQVRVTARQGALPDDELGVPFGYTNSLEGLISEGRQFRTIYAEPPWPCDLAPERGAFFYRKPVSGAELAALPVRQLAAPSVDVYLWAPDPFLLDAIRVLDAWGLTYTGSLVWTVPELDSDSEWSTVHQFLLHGARCDSPSLRIRPRSWFHEARHSISSFAMPYNVKSIIEQISLFPRLHLFNEIVSMGWTSWGQSVPRPFDPDEEDDWGPDEDDEDGLVERDDTKPLNADVPLIVRSTTSDRKGD